MCGAMCLLIPTFLPDYASATIPIRLENRYSLALFHVSGSTIITTCYFVILCIPCLMSHHIYFHPGANDGSGIRIANVNGIDFYFRMLA